MAIRVATFTTAGHTTRGDQGHLMLRQPIMQSTEVIRAIILEDSPCCGVPRTRRRDGPLQVVRVQHPPPPRPGPVVERGVVQVPGLAVDEAVILLTLALRRY